MKKAIVFLADGFEEIEAITIIDYLRRAGVGVTSVAVPTATMKKADMVTGSHNITVIADCDFNQFKESCKNELPDLVYVPGGMPGSTNVGNYKDVRLPQLEFVPEDISIPRFVWKFFDNIMVERYCGYNLGQYEIYVKKISYKKV